METTFDDILARAGNTQTALTRATMLVRERAEQDAPVDFCAMCTEQTPLALEYAHHIGTVRFVDRTATAAAERIEAIDGPLTDRYWVRKQLTDAYVEAFFDACADADDCEVCRHPDAYDECGHERNGEVCPARGDTA